MKKPEGYQSSFLRQNPHGVWFEQPKEEVKQEVKSTTENQKAWERIGSQVTDAEEEPHKVAREIIRQRQESGEAMLQEARRKANYANQSRPKLRMVSSADQIEEARYPKKRTG